MFLSHIFNSVRTFFAIGGDNPELLKAQRMALSRLIPLMYFMLSINGWILAFTFYNLAPIGLTVGASGVLTVVCIARVAFWWPYRERQVSARRAASMLKVTNVLAAVLAIAFVSWSVVKNPQPLALVGVFCGFKYSISQGFGTLGRKSLRFRRTSWFEVFSVCEV